MTYKPSLSQIIQRHRIEHPAFKEIFDVLCNRIDSALAGGEAKVSWVMGPSRVGKSFLISELVRRYPPETRDGSRNVPVLPVFIPPSTSPQLLPMTVLLALGAPHIRTSLSAGKLSIKMDEQLALAKTRVALFDEASHMVEPGARVLPYAAADWFKTLESRPKISPVMIGVPRLRKLLDASTQVRNRSYRGIEWRPYAPNTLHDQEAFGISVNTFLDLFVKEGWTFDLPLEAIVKNCYLHAPGLIGKLRDLMAELAGQVEHGTPRPLGLADFHKAASVLESAGDPLHPPFEKLDVPPFALNHAHQYVLSSNDML